MNRQEQADLIITQARAFTANPQQPWAESVAVRGNRIVFAGATTDALAWRGPARVWWTARALRCCPG